ncbi:helix-turn-helix transcriptional regulator [Streptomyces sp. Je 1-369]|uniref:helix-turn-helix transcriptional regulator n=1 Tax=Streptomyces sp. Je 1-369 TaxID=2966192 RepID=UPI00228682D4|nr:helix-turn-helix transcriptional regulator [Streptomyces sp. Je 1-369]WAL99107.1 AAA family ATPase [Streptomyces sp. Je 1-369]
MDQHADDLLVGRDEELAHLLRAVDPKSADRALLLVGEAGLGKSALLDRLACRVTADGVRVLRAEGSASEAWLPFAALHRLLRPVSAEVNALPERQRAALREAFGAGAGPPDLMLVGLAVLTLLSTLGERNSVVVILDDAHWFDRSSLDALAFAAARLAGEPVTMLLGTRDGGHLPGFGRRTPTATLTLAPLDATAADRLLELQPMTPTGRTRARILDEAGGNPLALTELTRAATTVPDSLPPAGPLPLPPDDRLEQVFAARLHALPAATGEVLLLLAAMDGVDAAITAPGALPDAEDDVWSSAERAGLIRRVGRQIRFRHPMARSAVYHAAPPDARRAAHRTLADALRHEPDRRSWHLAAACTGPDAAVSAELELTADRARRRGGHAAAAMALERAAHLAPEREDEARLLVEAAATAVLTGDLPWVEELTARVHARTDDASLLAAAAVSAGRLAVLTARHSVVLPRLADRADELTGRHPEAALDLLGSAAVVRFYSGEDAHRIRVQQILRRIPTRDVDLWSRVWVRTVTDPFEGRAELVDALAGLAAEAQGRPERLAVLGIMSWLLDETPRAVRAFDEAADRWAAQGTLPEGLGGAVAWAYVERGRWGRAREACARSTAVASAAGLDHAVACAAAVDATVLALRGDTAAARGRARDALDLIDPLESRSVAVYARRALGAAAAADGAYEAAYDQLRAVFAPDGAPVHYHASYPALADLAAVAVRSGRSAEACAIVERAARALGENASPRLRALLSRARGLLAAAEDAEPHYRAALADPDRAYWPFEHAQAQLDFAEWLRRRRRIAEARPLLTEALETFRRLGARPWTERARSESRAAGVGVPHATPDALAELSPQQRQIVGLAARGLTNRAIGERLFLSPRTVGSHLYRSFPKLGITARAQLRDLVEGTGEGG